MGQLVQQVTDGAGYVFKGGRLLQRCLLSQPFLCNWQVTYRCNFKCSVCSFWREPHPPAEELTTDQIQQIAERLRPLAPLVISMAGGEPLIRRDLPEIARILSADHYFTIITNGWFVTPELASRLYDNGLQDVHVSIDYATAARQDAQRGCEGAFDRAVRALEIFRETRPSRWHRVHIMAVLLDDNLEDLEPLIQLAQRTQTSFELSLYSHRRGQKPMRMPRTPVAKRLRELKAHYPETFVSMDGYLAGFDRAIEDGAPRCNAGRTFLNIDDRGRVSRCIDTNDQTVGSLLTEPVDLLLERLAGQSESDPCRDCWTSCRGFGEVMAGPMGMIRSLPDFYRAVRPL